jgi:hypothetical protein
MKPPVQLLYANKNVKKESKAKWTGGMTQEVGHLVCKH